MSPLQRYERLVREGVIARDDEQLRVLAALDGLRREIARARRRGPAARLARRLGFAGPAAPRGLYLWGDVGRGKTFLMDLFCESLPPPLALRTHFHRFMQRVHGELAGLKGRADPLERVAAGIADRAAALCFDEFLVQDIGDAMILGGLLEALFERGVALVATSNTAPDGLYENGLQRARFLPAIELIKHRARVIEIGAGTDYRLRALEESALYQHPLGDGAAWALERGFERLAAGQAVRRDHPVRVLNRDIVALRCAGDVAWFDFDELCGGPRSAFDYVELARRFRALILDGVPRLDDGRSDQVRRFVSLIDALYDRRTKLLVAAEAPPEALYRGGRHAGEFERTRSRLAEMRSVGYLRAGRRA